MGIQYAKKAITALTIFSFVVTGFMPRGAEASHPDVAGGSLIKGKNSTSVYYLGDDRRRHVFPNQNTYMSWYDDFNAVIEVNDSELAEFPLGTNIRYRPGVFLVKIQSDPKVYAVSANGLLRWIQTEGVAKELYGEDWNVLVDDVPVTFFTSYDIGANISVAADFDPDDEENSVQSINQNLLISLGEKLDQLEENISVIERNNKVCRQFEKRYERLIRRYEKRGLAIQDLSADFGEACPGSFDNDDNDDNDDDDDEKDKKKRRRFFQGKFVLICHIPPGNSDNAKTIKTHKAAARAHLAHGDTLGVCGDDDDGGEEPPVDTTPPVITNKSATSTPTTTTVTWNTNEASTSHVEYADESLSTASTTDSVSNNTLVTIHSLTLTGLTASTTYHYRVISKDAAGNTATSSEMTFVTRPIPPAPDTVPPVLSTIVATPQATTTTITWNTDESSTSKVTYADESLATASTTEMVSNSAFVTFHSLLLTGLSTSTQYFYRLESEDSSGNVATSTEQTFTTL